jgi:hypothetical protein
VRTKLNSIGNPRGDLNPVVEKGRAVIRPNRSPRQGWAAAFAATAEHGEDRTLLGERVTNAFDRDDWTW